MRKLIVFLVLTVCAFQLRASHIMGGSITYECVGGQYVFELTFFRDVNGSGVNTVGLNLNVWNHPTLNNISVPYVSTECVAPEGTSVPGGQLCYSCTGGPNVGLGSIEKITYRSAPITISGVPPAQGWVITYDDFSRNGAITNLQNPTNYGITLTAKIYNVNNTINTCVDNSAKFLQKPKFVGCSGKPFKLNLNPVDPDLDSIAVSFDVPLNNLNNQAYNPPTVPSNVPFVGGFSAVSPTPGTTLNPLNETAQIDPVSGEITFLSYTSGNFAVKIKVQSFRNGTLISEVMYEIQIIVTNCLNTNNPPIVSPPFGASFETTVIAGDPVNFTLTANDPEFLQNGSPQTVSMIGTGLLFGPDQTIAAGCAVGPCPTLSASSPISGIQTASVDFSWQTDCAHLLDANGNELDMVPYHFVFRVQDDYCPIPEVIYETVTINVLNPGVIQAPSIDCIQGGVGNDFTINWQPVVDPTGTFIEYQIRSVQDGLIASIPTIGTSNYTVSGVTQDNDYFITVVSGCSGNALRNSDTISNIYLSVSDLNPGIAVLSWNRPTNPPLTSMNDYFYIYREYPAGVWTLIDSTLYNVTTYEEVIDICDVFLNYQIVLGNQPCDYTSNISGGLFDDETPPSIPMVQSVTIDTLTGETIITWNQNDMPDTYGYLIYVQDPTTGFLIELDTIYGITNTSYSYLEDYEGALTYTVAAFDSCPSNTGAPFNLSARDPNFHTTIFTDYTLSICDGSANIFWSEYQGWDVMEYEVYIKPTGGVWSLATTTSGNNYQFFGTADQEYSVAIKAKNADGRFSFSNVSFFTIITSNAPAYYYVNVATVLDDETVEIRYSIDNPTKISKIQLEKNVGGVFESIQEIENPNAETVFIDEDVDVQLQSYEYRVLYFDSCGNQGFYSNIGRTILLNLQVDQTELNTYLTWSGYEDFNGSVVGYNIYRGFDDYFDSNPIATVGPFVRNYEDNIYDIDFKGKICYRVQAIEGSNIFNNPTFSFSNVRCDVVEPLIYVPNAFMPTGINNVFYPVIRNFDDQNYRLTIIDRWGQVVFQTTNYFEGWNGKFNNSGAEAEGGTYIYQIEMYDGNQEQIMTRGHVTLLR